MGRSGFGRVVAAVLSLTALAGGSASAVAAGSLFPKSLVGTWGKEIPVTTWARYRVAAEVAGHYAIRIAPGGVTSLYVGTDPVRGKTFAQRAAETTMPTAVSERTMTFGPMGDQACVHEATYNWAVSGPTLDFTLVKDDCGYRVVLMTVGRFTREH